MKWLLGETCKKKEDQRMHTVNLVAVEQGIVAEWPLVSDSMGATLLKIEQRGQYCIVVASKKRSDERHRPVTWLLLTP